MDEITSLTELEALANKTKDAQAAYDERYVSKKKFLGLSWNSGSPTDHNNVNDEFGMPKEIRLTTEMASFMLKDHDSFDQKDRLVSKAHHPFKHAARLPTDILVTLIFPHHALSTARNVANLARKSASYSEEYARIWETRDQTVGTILENYYLTQSESGDYVLQRGEWSRQYSSSAGSRVDPGNRGVDYKLDRSQLPDLPEPNKDKGRGR